MTTKDVALYVSSQGPGGTPSARLGYVRACVPFYTGSFGDKAADEFSGRLGEAEAALRIEARRKGGDAVLSLRIETTFRSDGFSFITLYGDAARF